MSPRHRRSPGCLAVLLAASGCSRGARGVSRARIRLAMRTPLTRRHRRGRLRRAAQPQRDGSPGPAPSGMVWIPGGEFWMGCDGCGMPDALPVHLVSVAGFWMDADAGHQFRVRSIRARDQLRDGCGKESRIPEIFPARRRTNSCPARSYSLRLHIRFHSMISPSGGAMSLARTGGIPMARRAPSRNGPSPGCAHRVRGRTRVRQVGRETPSV